MSNESTKVFRAIFVLLLILVGLLEWMAAGSKYLVGGVRGDLDHWVFSTVVLIVFGATTFALAFGVGFARRWEKLLNLLLTVAVISFSAWRLLEDATVDLTLILTFMLALATQIPLAAWLQSPAPMKNPGSALDA